MKLPAVPAVVTGIVRHSRPGPRGHEFTHCAYQWLIDLDRPPLLPRGLRWACGLHSKDHLGQPSRAIKTNVIEFVRQSGGRAEDIDQVIMLANARVAGYVFNPLSVHWCLGVAGGVVAVVVEVHNTYSQRHAYLLLPDEQGHSEVDKNFYVSPFNEVSGRYHIRTTLDGAQVAVHIALTGGKAPAFSASFVGVPQPATTRRVIRTLLRHPLMTLQISGWIRAHGIWLWARGNRVVRRPHHQPPPGV